MSYISNSTNISSSQQQTSTNDHNQETSKILNGYLKDHFNVSFIDCKCCCDASKEISKCQNGSLEFLRHIQEYINLPEYRLNCRCICGDNEQNNTPIKFGINLTPANDLK
ncbi:unnamed protein product [Rotaria sordida]|uniref:Uncharacterized protein n=1 Tax=Rotaria sordida TaxID=392033 RepID=A0A814D9W0_9BILA|nr:unnamed protein product [Rotaria sordida]CAF0833702.1 unnamed protein product [Rotaria sordida]CAF0950265.1 unnamed protein product [Rotaria sordida]CAF0954128.1 unnamed protein product [Rotaria sordida]CAF1197533.1 unnamed protein product [Rotaria sordida]